MGCRGLQWDFVACNGMSLLVMGWRCLQWAIEACNGMSMLAMGYLMLRGDALIFRFQCITIMTMTMTITMTLFYLDIYKKKCM